MISVVIPTRALSDRVGRCLEALACQTVQPREVIVVTSETGRMSGAVWRWPKTTVVPCPGVPSFCRSANLGIGAVTGEWVLLLNDDALLTPTFIERLIDGVPSDGRVGMVCGKLLAFDGRTIDSAGQFLSRARTALERGHGSVDTGQFDEPGYVFSAPGAVALYRRQMLEALAENHRPFNEGLGMYLEDLDLGWRAQRAGWRAFYVPQAVAHHARGGTAKSRQPRWAWLRRYYLPWLPPKLQARYILNRYRLIARHESWAGLLAHGPWLLWYELKLWTYLACCERQTLRLLGRLLRCTLRAGRACAAEGPSAHET